SGPPGGAAQSDARGDQTAAGPPQGSGPPGGAAQSDARGDHPGSDRLDPAELERISKETIASYVARATEFWEGTRDHDVSQNVAALLDNIGGAPPFAILDLGCGPGRDLKTFRSLGHTPIGIEGVAEFAAHAR